MRRWSLPLVSVALTVLPSAGAVALPPDTKVQLYEGNLSFPVDMAWVPHTKRLFFTEKNTGRIRVILRGRLLTTPCRDLAVASDGERGLLGIVLHPDFKDNRFLYVYYTNADPVENRITRFKVVNNRCRYAKHIVTGIKSASGYHNGGQLEFVAGKLFVSTGEGHDPANAQRRRNRLGKILRYNPDGSIPSGNPFNNAVWTLGHRNPFGLTHKPGTHRIYATENGPQCDDELNRIVKGRNYGWGEDYECGTAGVGTNPKPPLRRWTPTIVPTDPWWYVGRMRALSGSLYMGDFGEGRLHRFRMNSTGTSITRGSITFDSPGQIVDVTKGPGGWLYFATTTGIYRIVPE